MNFSHMSVSKAALNSYSMPSVPVVPEKTFDFIKQASRYSSNYDMVLYKDTIKMA